MAGQDGWYRSTEWTDEEQAWFEEKLKRARAWSRPQYLRIKANSLLRTGNPAKREAGRQLLFRMLREYPDNGEAAGAHETLAEAYREDRRYAEAEEHYRECLRLCAERGNDNYTSGVCDMALAELILETGDAEKYAEADTLLGTLAGQMERLFFRGRVFAFHLACARLAHRLGRHPSAAEHARAALALAAIEGPQFSHHPTVGLVETDGKTLRELRSLAD